VDIAHDAICITSRTLYIVMKIGVDHDDDMNLMISNMQSLSIDRVKVFVV